MAKKKDLRGLTKFERGKEVKKEFGQTLERLEATGQESEKKASKWVKEEFAQDIKRFQEEEAQKLQILQDKRKLPKIFSYKEQLAIDLANQIREGIPEGFWFEVKISHRGIVLRIGNRERTFRRRRAFAISGQPEYDNNAVDRFADWAFSEFARQSEKKMESGIYLP